MSPTSEQLLNKCLDEGLANKNEYVTLRLQSNFWKTKKEELSLHIEKIVLYT